MEIIQNGDLMVLVKMVSYILKNTIQTLWLILIKNVSGYIYKAKNVEDSGFEINIPDAITSIKPVEIYDVEYINDAYEEILEAEKDGLIKIIRYEEMSEKKKEWLKNTIKEEYKNAINHPEYRFFLEEIFPSFIFWYYISFLILNFTKGRSDSYLFSFYNLDSN